MGKVYKRRRVTRKPKNTPIEVSSSPEREESRDETTPLRSHFVLKNCTDIESVERIEECFILDYDPNAPVQVVSNAEKEDEECDIFVTAEKGQVACRDYPHSRHLCVKYPFGKTPDEKHCELCHCYVCDTAAPCLYWKKPVPGHCQATENVAEWQLKRGAKRIRL